MKVLVAGLGGIGQRHVRNLRSLLGDRVEIAAYRVRRLPQVVTERLDVEPGADVERRFDIRSFTDLDEALAARPDAVFVCNPSSLHIPVAIKAATAGCHLFIEKPLAHELAGVRELIAITESKGLAALVGFQMRFHPCFLRTRDLLAKGAVGRVLAVQAQVAEYLPGFHPYEDYRRMYAARRDLGGGVILSQIHELDYLYALFGLPRRVFAVGGHLSSLDVDVEDVASISMDFGGDRPLPVHLHQDFVQRPPARTCRIIGDAGRIDIDFRDARVRRYGPSGEIEEDHVVPEFPRNQPFLDEMRHFLACIDGRERPVVSLRDGACSLRMALAARDSIATARVVELDAGRDN